MASFRKLNNGRWQYRVRYKDIKTGLYKEKTKATFVRKADAIEAANKIEMKVSQGLIEADGNPLFMEYLIQTNKLTSIKLSANTRMGRETAIKHLKESFANIRLKDMTGVLVQEHLNNQVNKFKLGKQSVSKDLLMIRLAMKRARLEGYVTNDILIDVFIPKTKRPKPQAFWTLNNLKDYIDLQNDVINRDFENERRSHYRIARRNLAVIVTLAGSGARAGELCGLHVNDFDLKTGQLLIHHNLHIEEKNINGETKTLWIRSENMKTDNSWREVPLPDKTISILKSWIEYRTDFIKETHLKDDGSMFPSDRYQHSIRPNNLRLLCKQINDDYKLPNIHPHSFRHTYASLLQTANVSAKQAQILLGHGDIETTLNIYTHVTNNDKISAIKKLNDLMNPQKI